MQNRPVVPVYLNQRLVFDTLAILDNGIANVTSITDKSTSGQNDARKYGASFGLGQALSSLFQIGISGERTKEEANSSERTSTEERIHTPASLFFRLRQMLFDRQLVTVLGSGPTLETGALIELTSQLRRSPLHTALDSFLSVGKLFLAFQSTDQLQPSFKKARQAPVRQADSSDGMRRVMEQIAAVRESLTAGSSVDLVSAALPDGTRAVVTLESDFLNDPTMADLLDGHFSVLGKVIRVVPQGEAGISLVRRGAFGGLKSGFLEQMMAGLNADEVNDYFEFPALEMRIDGPAFHVIPLAIYA